MRAEPYPSRTFAQRKAPGTPRLREKPPAGLSAAGTHPPIDLGLVVDLDLDLDLESLPCPNTASAKATGWAVTPSLLALRPRKQTP